MGLISSYRYVFDRSEKAEEKKELFEQAIAFFDKILKINPLDPEALYYKSIALCYHALFLFDSGKKLEAGKEFRISRENFRELAEIEPDCWEALYFMGLVDRELSEYDKSVENFEKILKIPKHDKENLFAKYEKGLTLLNKGIFLYKESSKPRDSGEESEAENKFKDADENIFGEIFEKSSNKSDYFEGLKESCPDNTFLKASVLCAQGLASRYQALVFEEIEKKEEMDKKLDSAIDSFGEALETINQLNMPRNSRIIYFEGLIHRYKGLAFGEKEKEDKKNRDQELEEATTDFKTAFDFTDFRASDDLYDRCRVYFFKNVALGYSRVSRIGSDEGTEKENFKTAIETFGKALEIMEFERPDIPYEKARILYFKGLAHRENKECETACKTFDDVLRICPESKDTTKEKTRSNIERESTLGKMGDYEGAISICDTALDINPKEVDSIYNKGLAFLCFNDYIKVKETFKEVLNIKGDYKDTKSAIGTIEDIIEKENVAIENFLSNLNQYLFYCESGYRYRFIKKYDAKTKFEMNNKKGICSQLYLAKAYYDSGDTQTTEEIFNGNKLEDIDKKYPKKSYERGLFHHYKGLIKYSNDEKKDAERCFENACSAFEEVDEKNSKYQDAQFNKGLMLYYLKKYDKAMDTFEEYVKKNEVTEYKKGLAYWHMGLIHKRKHMEEKIKNEDKKAKDSFNNAIKAFDKLLPYPSYEKDLPYLPYNKEQEKQDKRVKKEFWENILKKQNEFSGQSLGIKDEYQDSWYHKGLALRELKRYNESICAFEKAEALNPDDAHVWYDKGCTYSE